jgi:uncharacterized protein YjbI with pentapeptide repeats
MKKEFNLGTVLEQVAEGKTPIGKAKKMIESHYTISEKSAASREGSKIKIKNAFEKIKRTVNLDDLLKKSTQFVQHISENVPHKLQGSFSPIGFSPKIEGIEAKFSVFRSVDIASDNVIAENQVVGSQWFGIHLSEKTELKRNKFMAIQMTEFTLTCSDFCDSVFSLSRFSHVTLLEACFLKNKLSLSTWSDVSVTESDFTENIVSRCDFSGAVLNSCRLSKIYFTNVNLKDCEFDSCDIQGIEFENCEFKECSFHHIQAVAASPLKISGCRFVGKQFSNCSTAEELIDMLKSV